MGAAATAKAKAAAAAKAVKPRCCWGKWGNANSCGGYTGRGAQCNTDHAKTCTSASDCPASPTPTPPSPEVTTPAPTPATTPAPTTPGAVKVRPQKLMNIVFGGSEH